MNLPKIKAAWILPLVALSVGWQSQPMYDTYEFTDSTKVWVEGTSTIHDWACKAVESEGEVMMAWVAGSAPTISAAALSVPVDKMDCHNGTMDKKLRQALKQKDNPVITFEMNSAGISAEADSFKVVTEGQLSMAGQTRTVELTQYATPGEDGTIVFRGSVPLSMKEYDMKRPSAMLGTIKAGDEVVVHFEVVIARKIDS